MEKTDRVLSLLKSPLSDSTLVAAADSVLAALNEVIRGRGICDLSGRTVSDPLEAGMVDGERGCLFPVRDGILILVADQAIPLP